MLNRIRQVLGTLLGVISLLCAIAAYVILEAGAVFPIPFYWWVVVLVVLGLFAGAELLLWPGGEAKGFWQTLIPAAGMLALLGLIWLLWWIVFG